MIVDELAAAAESSPPTASISASPSTTADSSLEKIAPTCASGITGGPEATSSCSPGGKAVGQQSSKKGCGFPSVLGELNLKVNSKGIVLPESRRAFLQRRHVARALDTIPKWALAWGPEAAFRGAERDKAGIKRPQLSLEDVDRKKKKGEAKRAKKFGSKLQVLDDLGSELFRHAFAGDAEACREVIDDGADVNARTNADIDGIGLGGTALHVAAARGHEEAVAVLLASGADAAILSNRGEAPVQLATRHGQVGIVAMLASCGAAPPDAEGALRLLDKAPSWDDRKRRLLHGALKNNNDWHDNSEQKGRSSVKPRWTGNGDHGDSGMDNDDAEKGKGGKRGKGKGGKRGKSNGDHGDSGKGGRMQRSLPHVESQDRLDCKSERFRDHDGYNDDGGHKNRASDKHGKGGSSGHVRSKKISKVSCSDSGSHSWPYGPYAEGVSGSKRMQPPPAPPPPPPPPSREHY